MGEPLNIRSERDFSEADSALVPKSEGARIAHVLRDKTRADRSPSDCGRSGSVSAAQTGRLIRLAAGKEAPAPAAGKLRGGERRHQGMPPYGRGCLQEGSGGLGSGRPTAGGCAEAGSGPFHRRGAAVPLPCAQGRFLRADCPRYGGGGRGGAEE